MEGGEGRERMMDKLGQLSCQMRCALHCSCDGDMVVRMKIDFVVVMVMLILVN